MNSETALRQQLREAGYAPIPVNGKRPALEGWQTKANTKPQEINEWEEVFFYAKNTGLLTEHTPTLDIDILDQEAATAVEELVRERFGERGYILVRFGQSPKRAIPFRTDTPFSKITCNVEIPDREDRGEKPEFLANGQQFVAFGLHPKTGKPYSWHGGEPGEKIKHEDLPYITEAEAQQIVAGAAELLKQFGYQPKTRRSEKSSGNGSDNSRGQADWSWLVENILQGRELHDSIRDLAGKLIASGMSEGAAVNHLRALMEQCTAPHDDRWQERLDDIPRVVAGSAQWKEQQNGRKEVPRPLPFLDMSNWDEEPIPQRKWAILDRVPLNQAGLFSGEGGAGKSIIELTKDVAHVTGKDWFGSLPQPGPAIYVGAEDDKDEIHIRLAAIASHYGVTFRQLVESGLHVLCLLGQDATLCAATSGKSGKVEVTSLYRQLYQAAGDIKPKNISIDTLSRAFAGNEMDRVQVYAFAMHMQALAMVAGGSVTILSHPSLSGIASGTGISGSTAWHGAFRFRQYLTGVKFEDGEPPDNDLRQLEFKKNQYGPTGETIVVRYQNGLFVPLPGMASLDKAAQEAKADQIFLDLLARFTTENRNVSHKKGPTYAPSVFAREEEAKRGGITGKALEAAMRRLFKAGKIWNEPYGKPSRPHHRIARKI
jgi:RecA-family ATPase